MSHTTPKTPSNTDHQRSKDLIKILRVIFDTVRQEDDLALLKDYLATAQGTQNLFSYVSAERQSSVAVDLCHFITSKIDNKHDDQQVAHLEQLIQDQEKTLAIPASQPSTKPDTWMLTDDDYRRAHDLTRLGRAIFTAVMNEDDKEWLGRYLKSDLSLTELSRSALEMQLLGSKEDIYDFGFELGEFISLKEYGIDAGYYFGVLDVLEPLEEQLGIFPYQAERAPQDLTPAELQRARSLIDLASSLREAAMHEDDKEWLQRYNVMASNLREALDETKEYLYPYLGVLISRAVNAKANNAYNGHLGYLQYILNDLKADFCDCCPFDLEEETDKH